MADDFISITEDVEVPYGKENTWSIYVRNSENYEENITPYHLTHEITQRLNQLWTFNLGLVSLTSDLKTNWVKKNNEILIFWGNQLRMKGRIEKISYDNYERCNIEGVGMAVLLRDRDIDEEYLNTNSDTIVSNVNNSIMSLDTNTNYGLISMHFRTENRLRALAGTADAIDYDWWENWKSDDDYITNYINVDDFKGDPDTTTLTFYTSGSSQNMHVIEEETDTYETTNYVTVLGYGDGINQLKSISYHATDNRTTLAKPLDAILETDVSSGTEVRVYDASGIDDGDTIRIDGESLTVSGSPTDHTTYWTIDVSSAVTQPHTAGTDVIKTSGLIYCDDVTVFDADSGNVWIGQEKISYDGRDPSGNTITIDSREQDDDYLNTHVVKAYYHGDGIEVVDAQYDEDSPETDSYIDRDGIRSRTFNASNIIKQNMLDYLAQRIRIDRQDEIAVITGKCSDPMNILSSENLQVGDWVELSDTYTGFETGTRYEVAGMRYGFNLDVGEFCEVEISNYNRTLLENTVKETENLGKYYKGATNIFQVGSDENCDKTHPLVIPIYIPPDAVAINKVLLSYYVDDYRAYATATEGGSAHSHSITGSTVDLGGDSDLDILTTSTSVGDSLSHNSWITIDSHTPTVNGQITWVHVSGSIEPDSGNVLGQGTLYCKLTYDSTDYPNSTGEGMYWKALKHRHNVDVSDSDINDHQHDFSGSGHAVTDYGDDGASTLTHWHDFVKDYDNNENMTDDTDQQEVTDFYTDYTDTDDQFAHFSFMIPIPENTNGTQIDVKLKCTSGVGDGYTVDSAITYMEIDKHQHGISGLAIANESDHTHDVGFAISDDTSEADGINVAVDKTGLGSSYEDSGDNPYNQSREQNIDITSLVGRESGWKLVKITPTDADGDGKCKIRGDVYVQTFVQSKT